MAHALAAWKRFRTAGKALAVAWVLSAAVNFAAPGGADDRIPLESLKVGTEVDAQILSKHRFSGWFVNIGTDRSAFLEFEEACDGFPTEGMNTWFRGSTLTARVLENDGEKIWLTTRSGSLERPKRFRTPPEESQIAEFSGISSEEWVDAEVCGMFPKGAWVRMTTPSTRTDFRCLLRKEHFTDSLGNCSFLMGVVVIAGESTLNHVAWVWAGPGWMWPVFEGVLLGSACASEFQHNFSAFEDGPSCLKDLSSLASTSYAPIRSGSSSGDLARRWHAPNHAQFPRLPCALARVGYNVRDMAGEVGSVPNGQCHDRSLSHPAAPPHPGPILHSSSPFPRRMFQSWMYATALFPAQLANRGGSGACLFFLLGPK
ncbi:unnamed protein product [Symbiodinium sp. CCMP2592]|nr:unnamed protein product [Symbiodinium sp. CCMP2592]